MKRLFTLLLAGIAGMAPAQTYQPPQHTRPVPLVSRGGEGELMQLADQGGSIEHDRPARWLLDEHRRLAATLGKLQPQRKGTVDAYVVAVALDSDPVFCREAREAGKVLAQRYGAEGRTVVLAGTDGSADSALPMGSPANLDMALARVAEVMDPAEDVLILYSTSHGAKFGIVYNDADQGFGAISPTRLWGTLSATVCVAPGHERDPGIPPVGSYIAEYCRRMGRDGIPDLDIYMAYNFFRIAGILQGILGRVRDGTAANANASTMSRQVQPLAAAAWHFAERAGA